MILYLINSFNTHEFHIKWTWLLNSIQLTLTGPLRSHSLSSSNCLIICSFHDLLLHFSTVSSKAINSLYFSHCSFLSKTKHIPSEEKSLGIYLTVVTPSPCPTILYKDIPHRKQITLVVFSTFSVPSVILLSSLILLSQSEGLGSKVFWMMNKTD